MTSLTILQGTQRKDAWWAGPAVTFVVLASFVVYATWAAFQNADYYVAPYLSPLYSPCLTADCAHPTIAILPKGFPLSPALLVLWAPGGFRLTCYYYRKAYYRAFTWSPPACAVADARKGYGGETRFPLILQNLHRYFFYAAGVVLLFLWWDAVEAFQFSDGFGVGVGTLVLVTNCVTLSLYTLSCHSCRHLCGGRLDVLSKAPARASAWRGVTKLNERHMEIAWVSLIVVALADVYVRLVASGVIHDVRLL